MKKLSMVASSAVLIAAVGFSGCGGSSDAPAAVIIPADSLRLSRDSSTINADGASILTVMATTNRIYHPTGSAVTFTATDGSFLPSGNSVVALTDTAGRARIQLKAGTDVTKARITATIGNQIAFDSIPFVRALPDLLSLGVDRNTLTPAAASPVNSAKLTAAVSRQWGTLTPGQAVQFSVFAAGTRSSVKGVVVSPARATAIAAAGQPTSATANLFADSTTVAGFVTVIAQTDGVNGKTLLDSVTIRISSPIVAASRAP